MVSRLYKNLFSIAKLVLEIIGSTVKKHIRGLTKFSSITVPGVQIISPE